jgi:hypothetical protein
VLLDAEVAFDPSVVTRTHPDPLPNLYKGSQMIVAARYSEPVPVTITLSGNAFGQPVSYSYPLPLSDSTATRYQFLTKVWAKLTIEDLLVEYYSHHPESPEALAIREQITELSLQFGVMSPFTSLSGGPPTAEEGAPEEAAPAVLADLGASPNPFHAVTTIRFRAGPELGRQVVLVKIYNVLGQLVQVLGVRITGAGEYEVVWDGRTGAGRPAPSGTYVYVIEAGDALIAGRVTLVR